MIPWGRPIAVVNPLLERTTTVYDPAGQPVQGHQSAGICHHHGL
jgi:YD repeat-containing protein